MKNLLKFILITLLSISLSNNSFSQIEVKPNGRVEVTATQDATGTTNTGGLEINNSLRLDKNEIITNSNTTLYLQHDNNGDLRVDGTTLTVDASTNYVGIRTTTPAYPLDVVGSIRSTYLRGKSTGGSVRINTNHGYLQVGPANSSFSHFYTDRAKYYFNKQIRVNGAIYPYQSNVTNLGASNLFYKQIHGGIFFDGNNTSYYVDPSNVTRLNYVLPVADDKGYCGTNASTWRYGYFKSLYRQYEYTLSDARTKENIRGIDNALDLLLQLDGKIYDFKTNNNSTAFANTASTAEEAEFISADSIEVAQPRQNANEESFVSKRNQADQANKNQRYDNYGFLAQDVQKIIPEVVNYNEEEDVYSMSYTQLVPILVEAIKEQQKQIDALKKEIEKK